MANRSKHRPPRTSRIIDNGCMRADAKRRRQREFAKALKSDHANAIREWLRLFVKIGDYMLLDVSPDLDAATMLETLGVDYHYDATFNRFVIDSESVPYIAADNVSTKTTTIGNKGLK